MTRSLSRRSHEDDETPRPRRALRADIDDAPARNIAIRTPIGDDETTPAKRPASLLTRHRIDGGGLATIQREMSGGGRNFNDERLELSPATKVIKFLEKDPYAAFRQHWVEASPIKRKSFVCLRQSSSEPLDACPLCAYEAEVAAAKGEKATRPGFKAYFNVVEVGPDAPTVKRLEAGAMLFDQIVGWSEQERTSPIHKDGLYWGVSRRKIEKGGNETWLFSLEPIKERDLPEDHNVEPLSEAELADLDEHLFTEDHIKVDDYDDLVDLVEQMRAGRRAA